MATLIIMSSLFFIKNDAFADSAICSGFVDCTNKGRTNHGYEFNYTNSYWKAYPGHNCTNYVGYMLSINGDSGHNMAMGDASRWDDTIAGNPGWGYTMNNIPAVGSIAQWEVSYPYTPSGHVAYVEGVVLNGGITTITISEDNYANGPYSWRTITSNSPNYPTRFLHVKDVVAATDSDGDGTPDSSDLLPTIKGPTNNRGVPLQSSRLSGDFNGDGNPDIAIFYDYGGGLTKLFFYAGDGAGNFASPTIAWDSGVGNWVWQNAKPVVGDFNKDGKSDIGVFYNYGSGRVKIWTFFGSSAGTFANPTMKWDSGVGNQEWERGLPLSGDFNGDGNPDIAIFYDYGGGLTKLFFYAGDGAGNFASPTIAWDSGVGNWVWQNAKPVVGDFNSDGKADIAVSYDYGSGQTKIWTFFGSSAGTFANPTMKWDSGTGNHDWWRSWPLAGDFNGDGKIDVVLTYDYGNSTSKIFTLSGDGGGNLSSPTQSYSSGAGNFGMVYTKPIVGDFNRDGISDIATFYQYGTNETRVWEFVGTSSGNFGTPTQKWASGIGGMEWGRVLVP